MISTVLTIISIALICSGLLFFLGAAVGLVRFPDVYTRMHAAGKGDTLSTMMILLGIAVFQFHDIAEVQSVTDFLEKFKIELFVAVKVTAISLFIMLTSPTSTHALTESAYEDGVSPFLVNEDSQVDSDQGEDQETRTDNA